MQPDRRDYRLFGLSVRSELPLPELVETASGAEPEVQIRAGKVPGEPDAAPGLHPVDGGLLLVVENIGRYFISGGSEIVVEADPAVPAANVRLFLLGSAMGALLHQRGLLPLHANAVEIDGRAFAFMGASGVGKSTLAAHLHDRGFRILADDVCVVRFDSKGAAWAAPGLPRLRLWKDALETMGRSADQYSRSHAATRGAEKYDVPIAGEIAVQDQRPLAAIYLLETGEKLKIEALDGVDAVEAAFANTYRGAYVASAGGVREHWNSCLKLVRATPLFLVSRRRALGQLAEETEQLIAHARQAAKAGGWGN